jgi:hypothetical protein
VFVERTPPKVWEELGQAFYQGCADNSDEFIEVIDDFWQVLNNAKKSELRRFIEYVLSDDIPPGMDKKYWRKSGADIYPSNIKPFLLEIVKRFNELDNINS